MRSRKGRKKERGKEGKEGREEGRKKTLERKKIVEVHRLRDIDLRRKEMQKYLSPTSEPACPVFSMCFTLSWSFSTLFHLSPSWFWLVEEVPRLG